MTSIRVCFLLACITISQQSFAQSNAFFRVESGGHTATITDLAVTADKRYLLSAAGDKTIRVWDTSSGKEVRKILGQIGTGSKGLIHAIALSADNKYLAVSVHGGETYNKGPDDRLDRIRLYDFENGTILKVIDPGNTDDLISLDFSEDGKYLVSGAEDHSVKVWDVQASLTSEKPEPVHTIRSNQAAQFQRIYAVEIFKHRDDYRIVMADYSEFIKSTFLYSMKQRKFLNSFVDRDRVDALAISDKYIAAAGYSHHILIFDLDLNLVKTIPYPTQPKALSFSEDGSLLLAGGIRDMDTSIPLTSTVFDANAGFIPIQSFSRQSGRVEAVAFIGNNTAVTAGGTRQEIYLWNARSGEVVRRVSSLGSTVFAVGINGNEIAFGNVQDYKADQNNYAPLEKTFDLAEFAVSNLFPAESTAYVRARAERPSQTLFIDPNDQWDLFIRKNNYDYRVWRQGGWYYHEAYGFTDDGLIISGGRGGEVRAYNNDGRMEADFVGHSNRVWDLAMQDNLLVTGGEDQTIKLWNAAEIRSGTSPIYPMLSLFVSADGEWVLWSKSGFYAASQHGDKFIGYHINQGEDQEALFYASDRFLKALYRPDIVRAILETGSEAQALKRVEIAKHEIEQILPPRISLTTRAHVVTAANQQTIRFEVKPGPRPVKRVWILRNDQFVWESTGSAVASGGVFEQEVDLLPGSNQFKIFAESEVAKSNPRTLYVDADDSEWVVRGRSTGQELSGQPVKLREAPPNLYILAVGVSEYRNNGAGISNLNFAHKDASAVVAGFEKQKGKVYENVFAKLLINGEATKSSVEEGIDWLRAKVAERDAFKRKNGIVSRDVTLVFLAGHGVKHDDDFYFLTHDADQARLPQSALKILDQAKVFTAFPTEVVIMTDACHSGAIGGDIIENIDVVELRKRLAAINERALVMFSATTSNKPSVENKTLGHGVFTKVMLDGLHHDEEVYLLQLISFVQRNVKKFTKNAPSGVQKPTYEQIGQLDDYLVGRQ